MATTEEVHAIRDVLDAIQTFQDNQIRSKEMSSEMMQLKEPANLKATDFLEKIVGKGNVSNKSLRKVLAQLHPHIVEAAKSNLILV